MKKNSKNQSPRRVSKAQPITIGMDLGDKSSRYCVLDENGEIVVEGKVTTSKPGLLDCFGKLKGMKVRVAVEVGSHSPWVSRLLAGLGFEVIVANPRQVKLISQSSRKDDRVDAETLGRLARIDPELLRPIRHRGEQAQEDLREIRVRAGLVEARTALVNSARGLAKAAGERLPKCDADVLAKHSAGLPERLRGSLEPLFISIGTLTEQIRACEARLEQIARTRYPETERLQQISGVGNLIALTFVLTVDDPQRFGKSRDVGCYVGMRPQRGDSGERQPQLPITKEGDVYLRKLLVQGAQHILSARGPDTDLKRWGLKLAARGGKNAKKRAIVAVARKLSILLHRLWVTGEAYEPLRNSRAGQAKAVAA